jgi:hypothetical protein
LTIGWPLEICQDTLVAKIKVFGQLQLKAFQLLCVWAELTCLDNELSRLLTWADVQMDQHANAEALYKQYPLADGQIRLLQNQPILHSDQSFRCSLKVVSVKSPGAYIAVSYT